MSDQPTPYRDAAQTYRNAGWRGVLPIPYRTKKMKATGWTGHRGEWPSAADVQAWCDSDAADEGGGNIALRLPPDVIGIDVDDYGDKHGGADLAQAVGRWGELPPTWKSTARDDGTSGIRLYRAPEGLRWPGQVGPSIEIIQTAHRYAVVWPSLHPEGRVYRWYRPDGMASLAPPRVGELPELPETWIVGLTGGELAEDVVFADMGQSAVFAWITEHGAGEPCRAMRRTADSLLEELRTGSAHESLRRLMALIRHGEKGHPGLAITLGEIGTAFIAEATNSARGGSTRELAEARGEWSRSLAGAVRRIVGNPSVVDGDTELRDPCDNPFAGLVADEARPSRAASSTATSGSSALATLTASSVRVEVAPTPTPEPAPTPPSAAELLDVANAFLMAGPVEQDVAPASPAQPAVNEAEQAAVEHTSWRRVDLASILAGELTEPEPVILERADGRALFYAGKVNGLLGESESSKSWILLAAAVQEMAAGRQVLYIDFEDTATSIVARLVALGLDAATIIALFTYIAPEEALHLRAGDDLAAELRAAPWALIGLDGVNAAMSLLGLSINDNNDATKFSQILLKPLARTGAAVVTVDHVGKDKETRGKGGIGAQAKRAMVTGCSLMVDVIAPFGRGLTGKLKLTVDKDRPGHVRGLADNSKNAGIVTLESGSNGSVRVRIDAADTAAAHVERKPFRPTGMMEKVSRLLSTTDGELTQRQIEREIDGRAVTVRSALQCLVEEGFVSRHAGPGNSMLHRYEKTYREMSELVGGESGDGPDDF